MDYCAEILADWAAQVAADRREWASWTLWLAWEDHLAYRNFPVLWRRGDTQVWPAFLQLLRERPDHLRRCQQMLAEFCYTYPNPKTCEVAFRTDLLGAPRPDGIDELIELLEARRSDERWAFSTTIHLRHKELRILRAERARDKKRDGTLPAPPDADQRTQKARSEIMYLEYKPSADDQGRQEKVSFEFGQIGRVHFSQTGKTLYYGGMALQSRKGRGCDSNYADTAWGLKYWISRCRRDGRDAMIRGVIEIDDDVREEYWTVIRQRPDLVGQSSFRCEGRQASRRSQG